MAVEAVDEVAQLQLTITMELAAGGLIRASVEVINRGEDPYAVEDCVVAFPIPQHAREILDFAGHWGKERVPQRSRRWVSGCICVRGGRAGPDRMRRPCCTSASRDFPSPTARYGQCTPAGAETTPTTRSGCSAASR